MLALRLDQAKRLFFDRAGVMQATTAAERQVLSRFGAFVRQRARTSIRPRRGTSQPGQPPFSHVGLLRTGILFAFDPERRSVVIGAVRLNQRGGEAPRLLEHGGTAWRAVHGTERAVRYRARPFMAPAFAAELARMPPLWKDSLR
ncbi:MAG: hypothetical protein H0X38_05160 [Planctomycetes bacterium]|nr:hypothetical protein [Planctomycetota bacterium]